MSPMPWNPKTNVNKLFSETLFAFKLKLLDSWPPTFDHESLFVFKTAFYGVEAQTKAQLIDTRIYNKIQFVADWTISLPRL